MQIVALLDGRNDGNLFAFRGRQFGERDDIAGQRAAGKWAAGTEIGLGPDARFAFQASGNFLRIRANVFT